MSDELSRDELNRRARLIKKHYDRAIQLWKEGKMDESHLEWLEAKALVEELPDCPEKTESLALMNAAERGE